MRKVKIKSTVTDFVFYFVGGAAYASAVVMFVSANRLSPGGVTGVATLLHYLFGIPTGVMVLTLNIPLLLLGFWRFGGIFVVKTALATAILSVLLDLAEIVLPALSVDDVLASVFGGVLMGTGLSLILLRGATTGGVDIVAKLVNRRFPSVTVGRMILLSDGLVVLLAALAYRNVQSALYSIVALYVSSRMTDLFLYGSERGKIIFIITEHCEEMRQSITSLVKRGVTLIDVTGGYTGTRRKMLMCTVRRHEVSSVFKLAVKLDRNAFIVVGEAGEIVGEGFKKMA
ncbi:MAG: YitT family protein [Clostridia bacterium]|nr:YitT family protein [Clostridia bacterium]